MAERVRVREIDDDEGRRLLRMVRSRRRVGGDPAAGPDGAAVRAGHAGREDRRGGVRRRGPGPGRAPQLQRRWLRGAPPQAQGRAAQTFTSPERREIKEIAKPKPVEHGLPFSTWSLAELDDFLVAEGVVDEIGHEGLRVLLSERRACRFNA